MTTDHPQFGLMCEICFRQLTPDMCAVGVGGHRWDICRGECARQAGIEEAPEFCPVHGDFASESLRWACPDDCPHFLAELERRVIDVKVHGNFTRMTTDDYGRMWLQRFRNHEPVGEPERWPAFDKDGGDDGEAQGG